MTRRFLIPFMTFVLYVPCFAEEELPSVPELLKRMYDYRMAIENMQVKVTVTKPVHTGQPHRESETQRFFFAYNKGRVRCDHTFSNTQFPQDWFYQYLSTPEFYYLRHPSDVPSVNDGNSLFVNFPLAQPLDTLDPRRIGADATKFDGFLVTHFNYDALMDKFYSASGENFSVSIDGVGEERLYQVTYQVKDTGVVRSYWINPQKGYSLVHNLSESNELDMRIEYIVSLDKFSSRNGEIWFPRKISFEYNVKGDIIEELAVVDSVDFDIQDETPFTLAGLNIPIGYRVEYFEEGARYWDGEELVDKKTYFYDPVVKKGGKGFLIIYGTAFAILAIWILYRYIRLRRRGTTEQVNP